MLRFSEPVELELYSNEIILSWNTFSFWEYQLQFFETFLSQRLAFEQIMDIILDLTTDFHFSAKNPIAIVKIAVQASHLMSLARELTRNRAWSLCYQINLIKYIKIISCH
jgi:hypothetical protein